MREREQRQRNVKKYLLYLYYNKSYLVVRPLSTKKKKNKIMGGGEGRKSAFSLIIHQKRATPGGISLLEFYVFWS